MKQNIIDEYNKRLQKTNEPSGQPEPINGSTQEEKTSYYDLARQQEYSTLFDKEVALENAKQQALKYTQNQINARGFGGTGYGSSLQAGTYNNYLNRLGEAQTEYNNSIKMINAEEQASLDAQANDRFQSVTTMLSQASDVEQMDELLKQYGYGTYDESKGEFVWNEKPEGMSDDDWYQIQYYYNLQKSAIDQGTQTGTYYNSLDGLNNMTFIGKNGTATTFNANFAEEAKTVWHYATNGTYGYGDVIKVANKNGNTVYLEWTKKGFKQINESQYEESKNRWELKNSGNGVNTQNITNKKVSG